ncbi:transcriptional regulator [Methyloglobulus morosus KoM1]|uniref:Transcriptional regulator n=1 Tax=Methyloglobulus morosus KoM1 TaxID=1116472 RepID=V5BI06_9GAMM|nr:TetR/AcrR family transcriptional regulator [Methyloglobulus morosus]ESS67384.1 transcriptional regulator [Methyloglobulus morosus KoM1]
MRRTKQQTAETKQQIIKSASALFRERGVDGVSVAEVMDKAGLTHGGFYKHFESKEALLTEAIADAFANSMCAWEETIAKQDDYSLTVQALINLYLSENHLKDTALGCPAAALGTEIARHTGGSKKCFAEGVKGMIGVFDKHLEGINASERKDFAVTTVACLVGTLMIARCAENDKTAQSYTEASNKTLLRLLSSRNPGEVEGAEH